MARLFIALEPPAPARQWMALAQGGVPGARWVPADNLHLTLRFLGDIDDHTAADLDAQFGRIDAPGFPLKIQGVGSFGTERSPSMLWAGVARSDPLQHLRDKVDRAVVAAGLAPDDRKFKPHVTLARLRAARRDRVGRWLEDHAGLTVAAFPVERFALYQSHLNRDGAVYEALAEYPLRPLAEQTAGAAD